MVKKQYAFLSALVAALLAVAERQAEAQLAPHAEDVDELVVTATRTEAERSETGSSIFVIKGEDLERKKELDVADILRSTPGVDVVSTGGPGGNVSVFLRGANPEHTIVLIDGIEANNPMDVGRSFNFANLTPENIERIEVLRGPQSTLYGSDALGGVINIITKKGKGAPHGDLTLEGGSYQSYAATGGVGGSAGETGSEVNYSIGVTHRGIGAVSAAEPSLGNSENDRYENTGVSSRVGVSPLEGLTFNHILRYNDSETELDNAGGAGGDDPNRSYRAEQLFTRLEADVTLLEGTLNPKIGVSYNDQNFRDDNDPDLDHPGERLRSRYDGSIVKFDLLTTYEPARWVTLLGGLETQDERGDSSYRSEGPFGPLSTDFPGRSVRTNAYFLDAQFHPLENFHIVVGGRVDDHEKFGTEPTWRVAPTYSVESTGTRFFGSIGSGYKAPSLYQLYSQYGREDLEPEESIGWDLGVEQSLIGDAVMVGATYFHNDFEELISFDPATFLYTNIREAKTEGAELSLRAKLADGLSLVSAYTYTDTNDEETGLPLLRRARHKARIDLQYRPVDAWSIDLSSILVGRRQDNDFSGTEPKRVALGGYSLLNLTVAYRPTPSTQLYLRAENLLDKEYEEVAGYGVQGFGVFGGLKLNFG